MPLESYNPAFRGSNAMLGGREPNPELSSDVEALLQLLGKLGAGPAADALSRRANAPGADFLQSLVERLVREGRVPSEDGRGVPMEGRPMTMQQRQEMLRRLLR